MRGTVAFDVDGTLIHSVETAGRAGDHDLEMMPREHVVRSLKQFKDAGWTVVVHSGGGDWYAEQVVKRLGLSKWVDRCEAKDTRIKYDVCIDDYDCALGVVNIVV